MKIELPNKRKIVWFLICFSIPLLISIPVTHYGLMNEYDRCLKEMPNANCNLLKNWDGYYGYLMNGFLIISFILGMIIPSYLPDKWLGVKKP